MICEPSSFKWRSDAREWSVHVISFFSRTASSSRAVVPHTSHLTIIFSIPSRHIHHLIHHRHPSSPVTRTTNHPTVAFANILDHVTSDTRTKSPARSYRVASFYNRYARFLQLVAGAFTLSQDSSFGILGQEHPIDNSLLSGRRPSIAFNAASTLTALGAPIPATRREQSKFAVRDGVYSSRRRPLHHDRHHQHAPGWSGWFSSRWNARKGRLAQRGTHWARSANASQRCSSQCPKISPFGHEYRRTERRRHSGA